MDNISKSTSLKISKRTGKIKQDFLELLEKYPIIQVACEKAQISRQTYYRWIERDEKFSKMAEEKLRQWKSLVNDIAETGIITAVKNNDLRAIMYWLNNNHSSYSNRPIQQNIILQNNPRISKKIKEILESINEKYG